MSKYQEINSTIVEDGPPGGLRRRNNVANIRDNLKQGLHSLSLWIELFPLSRISTILTETPVDSSISDVFAMAEAKIDPTNPSEANLYLSAASQISQAMMAYFLPMLYGLLGACAYILRSLSRDVQNITFAKSSVIEYRLRLPLGMLAGIAVGWFLRPEGTAGNLGSIGPLALAFLAGYSVELVFLAMDRVIGAFGTDSNK